MDAQSNNAEVVDLCRELDKARETLAVVDRYLTRHAEMNAALHCAERVIVSPLGSKVQATLAGIDLALKRTEAGAA